ncbi:hypothetical protein [Sphingopyxis sp.]|jgi:ABC-type multidrug transport system permease subunit|uniref:hypothetical protein n=1 Tax=Sphingopyxis sp. TaxID=1908224 RepID=UPI0035B3C57F
MKTARFVQAGFFITGIFALVAIYLGIGGWLGLIVAIAATMPFSAAIIFGMRCSHCGVSYYFASSKNGWNLTGVNLFRPVGQQCPKCGAAR